MTNEDNPFRQPEGYWSLSITVPRTAMESAEALLEDGAVSISSFEADPEGERWQLDALFEDKPDLPALHAKLELLAEGLDIAAPELSLSYLQQRDWVSEVQKNFPPLLAGRYFIYGSHYEGEMPEGTITIRIDAGAAFGSGEHETTSTCLEALDDLAAQGRDFKNMLDMGCGSGILALAMAKTWQVPVIAADIDPIAVEVSERNGEINAVPNLRYCTSDGYRNPLIGEHAPFDLIVANILARPLMELAPDLERHLAEGGVAVLSGLLGRQEDEVMAAHTACGLKLVKRFARNGWHTLVLARG